nr:uncharacterized protein LOC120968106 [Aegilops tauschii subsp. strangulata]
MSGSRRYGGPPGNEENPGESPPSLPWFGDVYASLGIRAIAGAGAGGESIVASGPGLVGRLLRIRRRNQGKHLGGAMGTTDIILECSTQYNMRSLNGNGSLHPSGNNSTPQLEWQCSSLGTRKKSEFAF